jgi:hypothetical protein
MWFLLLWELDDSGSLADWADPIRVPRVVALAVTSMTDLVDAEDEPWHLDDLGPVDDLGPALT